MSDARCWYAVYEWWIRGMPDKILGMIVLRGEHPVDWFLRKREETKTDERPIERLLFFSEIPAEVAHRAAEDNWGAGHVPEDWDHVGL